MQWRSMRHKAADAFPGKTLLDVLKQGGGDLKTLGRLSVAAC
jgi:hypothetical protein